MRCLRPWAGVGCRLAFAAALGAVAALIACGAEIPEEDSVLVLDDKSFEAAIKAHAFILVLFYAPWCGHCKQFMPEFVGAAKQLKQASPPIPLAKVDATAEYKLAEEQGVRGYPTIRLFVEGREQEYTGGRTTESIMAWVTKKTGPPALQLADVAAAEAFEKANRLGVVGVFDEGTSRVAFETAARNLEDVMFAYTTSPAVAARYEVKVPGMKMFFPHDEFFTHYSGDMHNAEAIERFVNTYRHPLVMTFNGESAPELFGDGRPILFLFRDDTEKGKAAEQALRKAAQKIGRGFLMSVSGSSEPMEQRLMDYVSIDPEAVPTACLVANPMDAMKKYRFPEGSEVTEERLLELAQHYEAGRLKPYLKSEDPPASQSGPVVQLVGSTFDSYVQDEGKDVLVTFYAPWCGHCKKLEPVYREVAKKVESVSTLTIAKIDATQNDVQGVDIEGFPTIKLWRAQKKDEPLDYDGDREVDSMMAWLEEKVTHPFAREELGRSEL